MTTIAFIRTFKTRLSSHFRDRPFYPESTLVEGALLSELGKDCDPLDEYLDEQLQESLQGTLDINDPLYGDGLEKIDEALIRNKFKRDIVFPDLSNGQASDEQVAEYLFLKKQEECLDYLKQAIQSLTEKCFPLRIINKLKPTLNKIPGMWYLLDLSTGVDVDDETIRSAVKSAMDHKLDEFNEMVVEPEEAASTIEAHFTNLTSMEQIMEVRKKYFDNDTIIVPLNDD